MTNLKWHAFTFSMVVGISLIIAGNVLAVDSCKDIDLRSAEPGVKCITSKGGIYERVSRQDFGEAWRGPDGLIWSKFLGNETQPMAEAACQNIGATLPKNQSFERGEENGFREVLPNMNDHETWWSSSVYPNLSGTAYVFKISHYYDIGLIGGDDRFNSNSIRCVAR